MDNKFWIAQSLTPATDLDGSQWGLESSKHGHRDNNMFYGLIILFVGWVLGMLSMVALIG